MPVRTANQIPAPTADYDPIQQAPYGTVVGRMQNVTDEDSLVGPSHQRSIA